LSKKNAIEKISLKYGRGYWSILRIIDGTTNKSSLSIKESSLFDIK